LYFTKSDFGCVHHSDFIIKKHSEEGNKFGELVRDAIKKYQIHKEKNGDTVSFEDFLKSIIHSINKN
jgi:hypothetical protein